jgi:hypothetical protein
VLLNGMRFEVIGSIPHLGRGDNTWLNMRGYIPVPGDGHELPDQGRKPPELHFLRRISAAHDR